MADRKTDPLEQAMRYARHEHRSARYPGDLAADLGLGGDDTRPDVVGPRPWWRSRWVPALAAAAAVLIAGAVVWLTVLSPDTQGPADTGPVVVRPPGGTSPVVHVGPTDLTPAVTTPRSTPATLLAADITPDALAQAKQRVVTASARARQEATASLGERWVGRAQPPAPSLGGFRVTLSLGAIPPLRLPDLQLPGGNRMPAVSFYSLRKELS